MDGVRVERYKLSGGLAAAATITGNITLTSGTLNDAGFIISVAGNITGTATHASSTAGGYLSLTGSSPTTTAVTLGNFNIPSTTTVSGGANVVTVNGSITGNGAFTSTGSGKILMTGNTATSNISGITVTNLELNNSSFNFSLTGSPTVTTALVMTNGSLTINTGNTLTLSNASTITRNSSTAALNLNSGNIAYGTTSTDVVNVVINATSSNTAEINATQSPGKVGTLTVSSGATYTFTGGRTIPIYRTAESLCSHRLQLLRL